MCPTCIGKDRDTPSGLEGGSRLKTTSANAPGEGACSASGTRGAVGSILGEYGGSSCSRGASNMAARKSVSVVATLALEESADGCRELPSLF